MVALVCQTFGPHQWNVPVSAFTPALIEVRKFKKLLRFRRYILVFYLILILEPSCLRCDLFPNYSHGQALPSFSLLENFSSKRPVEIFHLFWDCLRCSFLHLGYGRLFHNSHAKERRKPIYSLVQAKSSHWSLDGYSSKRR